jgi:hypothetical protein
MPLETGNYYTHLAGFYEDDMSLGSVQYTIDYKMGGFLCQTGTTSMVHGGSRNQSNFTRIS